MPKAQKPDELSLSLEVQFGVERQEGRPRIGPFDLKGRE